MRGDFWARAVVRSAPQIAYAHPEALAQQSAEVVLAGEPDLGGHHLERLRRGANQMASTLEAEASQILGRRASCDAPIEP